MTWFLGSHFAPLENTLRFFPGLVLQGLLQQYKWPAAIVLVLLGLQAALIGILLYEQRRRKRANDALGAAARVFDTTGDSFFRSLNRAPQLSSPRRLCVHFRTVGRRFAAEDRRRIRRRKEPREPGVPAGGHSVQEGARAGSFLRS